MKNLIIAHGEDLDGIVAHTLLGMHAPESTHVLTRHKSLEADFDSALSIVKEGVDQVYVADVSFGESLFSVVNEISQRAPITWIDHHDLTLKNVIRLMRYPRNTIAHHPYLCSSELVAMRYLLHSNYAGYLADLAQRSDYPDRFTQTELGKRLEKAVALLNFRKDDSTILQFIEELKGEGTVIPSESSLSPKWEEKVEEYNNLEQSALDCLYESGRVYTIGTTKVVFSHTSNIIPGKQATRALRDHFSDQADLFVVLFDSPSNSHCWMLRKERFPFPSVELCEYLGGGGRGKGGGFPWSESVTSESYIGVSDAIAARMRESGYFK
ncbi:MAG: hypothetical protein WCV90_05445 [Candidatus Woesearchaeota archaeon]|jgi:hypothetical protein